MITPQDYKLIREYVRCLKQFRSFYQQIFPLKCNDASCLPFEAEIEGGWDKINPTAGYTYQLTLRTDQRIYFKRSIKWLKRELSNCKSILKRRELEEKKMFNLAEYFEVLETNFSKFTEEDVSL